MISQQLPPGKYCVSFAYREATASTVIDLKTISPQSTNKTLWTVNERAMPDWKNVSVPVSSNETFQVAFVVHFVRVNHVGIDNIQIAKACDNLTLQHGNVSLLNQTAAQFTCDVGYKAKGHGSSVCTHGTWSNLPLCEPVDCGTATAVDHGNVTSHSNTYQSTATYTCISGYNLRGNNTIRCRSNGQWSQVYATCHPVDCHAAPTLNHGHVTSNATTFPSSTTYTCEPGYILSGNSTIQCLSSGQWSSKRASCKPVDCHAAPTLNQGHVTSNATTFPSSTTYTCEPGYILSGNSTIQCLSSGQWSSKRASCKPVDCHAAPTLNQGHVTSNATTFPSSTTYTCDPGYILSGNSTIQCLSSGQWSSKRASCKPVDCHAAPTLNQGHVTSNATTFPSSTTYTCEPGYILSGNSTIQCLSSGQWSSKRASCKPVDCHAAPTLNQGHVTSNATTFPSSTTYTCEPGYILSGNSTIQCLSSGHWSSMRASCKPVDCHAAPTLNQGHVTSNATTFPSSTTYTCEPGYILSGNSTIQCLSSGQWSSMRASCKPVDCHAPPTLNHGHVTSNATTFPSSTTYTCEPGYILSGNSTIQCLSSGQWSSKRASCKPVDCHAAPTLNQGHVTSNATTFPSSTTYTCEPGYILSGNSTIQCLSSGQWSSMRASCKPVDCHAAPTLNQGHVSSNATTFPSSTTYTCEPGNILSGNSTIQCLSSGHWSPLRASCKPVDCGAAPGIDNGNVSSVKTTYLSVAIYTCETGYNISGNNTIQCMRNGNWSSVMATCSPVDCGAAPDIDHGNVSSVETTYLFVATYTCETGYNIRGDNIIHCMSNGNWSSVMATCSPVDCNAPSTIENGNVTAQTTTYHSVASYTCDPGYDIIGSRTIQCMSNGNWSHTQATCKPVDLLNSYKVFVISYTDCGAAPDIDHGNVSSVETTYLFVATYTCETGYNIRGDNIIHCMSNGNWSSVMATCSPVGKIKKTICLMNGCN
ncbi:sushi, von Willebrand factor type A, EGF and pentraxin domain-containing protein 1-like [Mya arenaria]|uniref:sushi, von Willebrand factor type A, EGF and pentraxin domain-containing protein 1-like n=1 Tax=Mya arenaria TaxID=6604 RepID=UPI0022E6B56D|nr:sushi, von Willebrand factor type A, EGF and pentraxin domain-containing protein 1-like [Mya arenaria]